MARSYADFSHKTRRDQLEDLGMEGGIRILYQSTVCKRNYFIYLQVVREMDQRWFPVNIVINLLVP